MAIPEWINKTVNDSLEKNSKVNFSDETHSKLLAAVETLPEADKETLEQISQLLGVINVAVGELGKKYLGDIKKEAAPRVPPAAVKVSPPPPLPAAKLQDADLGMGSGISEPQKPMMSKPKGPGKLPAKIKEPETTKWNEIRFNKRTGTWQVVITVRHTRNFLSENEAVDFTKKASLNTTARAKYSNISSFKGEGYYIIDGSLIVKGPYADLIMATKDAKKLEQENTGKIYRVEIITVKNLS